MKFPRVFIAALTLFALLATGCSSIDNIDASTPEGAYKLAEAYEKDERYEEAVQKYQDVKSKFPYSKLATEAELKVADMQFKREAYAESQAAYQLFKEFHPKHARIDYVTYQLALSCYNQLPDTIDRDISVADKAILYFDELTTAFPNSEFTPEAKKKREQAQHMKAEKEMYIADFYMKREIYLSAMKRYEQLLKVYPNLGFEPRALFGAAKSAFTLGEREKGLQHFRQLVSLYPGSKEAEKAKGEFSKYGAN